MSTRKKRRLLRLLSAPDNTNEKIRESVGDMKPQQMIQVQIKNPASVQALKRMLDREYPDSEFVVEHFRSNNLDWAYIYYQRQSQRPQEVRDA